MNFLRLRRTPKLAVPKHETDTFFVDADGVFKKMGPDGSVVEVGSGGGGGSVPYVRLALRHSADFANIVGGAPVASFSPAIEAALTLPPSLFGNDSIIDALVYNPTASDVVVTCTLVVQSADGTIWIQQDSPGDQTIAAGGNANIDFAANSGSAGVGLSWNSVTKQVDIANAGVYSAFFTIEAQPA